MEEDKIIDQAQLAESVSKSIPYTFQDYFLVKPLDPIKVKKEFNKPVETKTVTDDNGVEAEEFEKVETEVREVDSDYRKGVVIKCPSYYDEPEAKVYYKIGDIVLFRETAGMRFDLVKDSRLLRLYDILGVEK